MDLRNYGVIDFAEHVKLPTGDADDLHDLDALTQENIGIVSNPFRKGVKQKIIEDLQKTNAKLSQKLLDIEKEQARSNELFAHKYSELIKTAEDRDKKEEENRNLKAQIKKTVSEHNGEMLNLHSQLKKKDALRVKLELQVVGIRKLAENKEWTEEHLGRILAVIEPY